jgi:periplasmic divalent cation tolerance protein
MNHHKYSIIMTTTASQDDAKEIANLLLEGRLAACVQIFPVLSLYTWEGKVNEDPEHILFIKAKNADYAAIETTIKEKHKYDVPEIIRVPIVGGSASYLSWVDEITE